MHTMIENLREHESQNYTKRKPLIFLASHTTVVAVDVEGLE